ncbi:hypothetical protein NA78x_004990 [Anatilimnocola sp. NA78]|uniref:tetratricopeptide repeat protein n=1 Tax=Anatilimnocola sp. NA78 TaxID=3415683 RepID=UPI003CE4A7BF
MKMPSQYNDDLLGLEGQWQYPDGTDRRVVAHSVVYPPNGFLPFLDLGTGDYFGYYWPLGKESEEPLVAFSSHYAHSLIPEYSNLSNAAKCKLAKGASRNDHEFRDVLLAAGLPEPSIDFREIVQSEDHGRLLALDPHSPFHHCAYANQLVVRNELEQAEIHYRQAVELLPEYGVAHFGLGYLLRRTRRMPQAAVHLRAALVSPITFWGYSYWRGHALPGDFCNDWPRKALLWLQQLRELPIELRDDPFLARIKELKLTSGQAADDDLPILRQIVDEYITRRQWFDAVMLWTNLGDRASAETTSFRERHRLTARSFAVRLAELLRLAGNEQRALLVESRLATLSAPEGLHL